MRVLAALDNSRVAEVCSYIWSREYSLEVPKKKKKKPRSLNKVLTRNISSGALSVAVLGQHNPLILAFVPRRLQKKQGKETQT